MVACDQGALVDLVGSIVLVGLVVLVDLVDFLVCMVDLGDLVGLAVLVDRVGLLGLVDLSISEGVRCCRADLSYCRPPYQS